ncbi:hypothetical protein BCR34DRAFT_606765 [Clohesyomyces aquaticus]|uniref:PD-(D/E)XK nuclease-like domain-containing protein n=1 Tax=Clohesyomyces aquaticus TaxID=1231657 RepID=A0A1Y1YLQ8_9PLEO|nr:hypothetical protein BCR34DRAFT_606765 [Clohesyomyces aquaticus]
MWETPTRTKNATATGSSKANGRPSGAQKEEPGFATTLAELKPIDWADEMDSELGIQTGTSPALRANVPKPEVNEKKGHTSDRMTVEELEHSKRTTTGLGPGSARPLYTTSFVPSQKPRYPTGSITNSKRKKYRRIQTHTLGTEKLVKRDRSKGTAARKESMPRSLDSNWRRGGAPQMTSRDQNLVASINPATVSMGPTEAKTFPCRTTDNTTTRSGSVGSDPGIDCHSRQALSAMSFCGETPESSVAEGEPTEAPSSPGQTNGEAKTGSGVAGTATSATLLNKEVPGDVSFNMEPLVPPVPSAEPTGSQMSGTELQSREDNSKKTPQILYNVEYALSEAIILRQSQGPGSLAIDYDLMNSSLTGPKIRSGSSESLEPVKGEHGVTPAVTSAPVTSSSQNIRDPDPIQPSKPDEISKPTQATRSDEDPPPVQRSKIDAFAKSVRIPQDDDRPPPTQSPKTEKSPHSIQASKNDAAPDAIPPSATDEDKHRVLSSKFSEVEDSIRSAQLAAAQMILALRKGQSENTPLNKFVSTSYSSRNTQAPAIIETQVTSRPEFPGSPLQPVSPQANLTVSLPPLEESEKTNQPQGRQVDEPSKSYLKERSGELETPEKAPNPAIAHPLLPPAVSAPVQPPRVHHDVALEEETPLPLRVSSRTQPQQTDISVASNQEAGESTVSRSSQMLKEHNAQPVSQKKMVPNTASAGKTRSQGAQQSRPTNTQGQTSFIKGNHHIGKTPGKTEKTGQPSRAPGSSTIGDKKLATQGENRPSTSEAPAHDNVIGKSQTLIRMSEKSAKRFWGAAQLSSANRPPTTGDKQLFTPGEDRQSYSKANYLKRVSVSHAHDKSNGNPQAQSHMPNKPANGDASFRSGGSLSNPEKLFRANVVAIPRGLRSLASRLLNIGEERFIISDLLRHDPDVVVEVAKSSSLLLYRDSRSDPEPVFLEKRQILEIMQNPSRRAPKHFEIARSVDGLDTAVLSRSPSILAEIMTNLEQENERVRRLRWSRSMTMLGKGHAVLEKLRVLTLMREQILLTQNVTQECVRMGLGDDHKARTFMDHVFQDFRKLIGELQSVTNLWSNTGENSFGPRRAFLGLLHLSGWKLAEPTLLELSGTKVCEAYQPQEEASGFQCYPGHITFALSYRMDTELRRVLQRPINPTIAYRDYPFAVLVTESIEVDETEATRRLQYWAMACFYRLRAFGRATWLMPIPLVLITNRGSYQLFFAQDLGSHITMTKWMEIGSEDTLRGWYQKYAVICCLAQWIETEYKLWFKAEILGLEIPKDMEKIIAENGVSFPDYPSAQAPGRMTLPNYLASPRRPPPGPSGSPMQYGPGNSYGDKNEFGYYMCLPASRAKNSSCGQVPPRLRGGFEDKAADHNTPENEPPSANAGPAHEEGNSVLEQFPVDETESDLETLESENDWSSVEGEEDRESDATTVVAPDDDDEDATMVFNYTVVRIADRRTVSMPARICEDDGVVEEQPARRSGSDTL